MKKKKKKIKLVIALFLLVAIAVMTAFVYKLYFEKSNEPVANAEKKAETVVEEKKVQIFQGNERPIAVMIDNHKGALPHSGLSKAYMVYEMLVEGGETRLMALFKGQNIDEIGPVRSSRHYYLDYALENDAIYVHYGWSPQAESDIKSLGVNNINGLYDDAGFWRTKVKSAPHNAMTSTEKILNVANSKEYRTTSDSDSVLKYKVDEVNLDSDKIANTVTIPFSTSNKVKWEYDKENKRYLRYTRGIKEIEQGSEESVTAKNIIIEFVKNSDLNDGENKGRQTLSNVGTHEGYYITNGKAIKITCEKTTRKSKTKYLDSNGNEINVNDGNTFVQICPTDAKVEFEGDNDGV